MLLDENIHFIGKRNGGLGQVIQCGQNGFTLAQMAQRQFATNKGVT